MSENQNTEWKESWHDDYLKWICGFANTYGGKLYIGKDNSGKIIGVPDYKRQIEDIPNKIINHLGIVCDVNLLKDKDRHYIEIIVPPYNVPISYHGKYYYRSGSTKQELKGNALTEFLLKKAGKTWDDIIEPNATLQDIDPKAIEAFKRGAIKSQRLSVVEMENDILHLLQNLRLTEGKNFKRAAILLFGKDPCKFFISAYVKIGRFGNSDADLLSQEVIEGNIIQLADQTLEILDKKYLKRLISYEGIQRVETPEYPYEAVREILLNAIVHKQYFGPPIQISIYDEKLMIWNAGVLPEALKIEDLKQKHGSYPRNLLLADIFFKGGLIEAWGKGTLKIIEECKKAGLPEPLIEEMTGGICITLYKKAVQDIKPKQLNLTEKQIKVVEFIKVNGRITNKDYQKLFSVSRVTASTDLLDLVKKGIIQSSGIKGVGSFYTLI